MSALPLLKVENLQAGYQEPVMGPVSFTVSEGEVVGLRGPSGSGKSTLMNAIGGTAQVFHGSVSRRQKLLVAHQHQHPLPLGSLPLSGRDLLRLTGASPDDLPARIASLIDQRLDSLSGGQLQFLQVWAALRAPVDLVLLDEPTNNLDRAGVQTLADVLKVPHGSKAILLVSHDQNFLEDVSDQIVELRA